MEGIADFINGCVSKINIFKEIKFYFFEKLKYKKPICFIVGPLIFIFFEVFLPITIFIYVVNYFTNKFFEFNVLKLLASFIQFVPYLSSLLILLGIIILYIYFWINIFRLPRISKGKIGIAVGVALDFLKNENIKEGYEKREMIKREIERIVDLEGLNKRVRVIFLNDYQTNRVFKGITMPIWASNFFEKTRISFVMFGYSKRDSYGGAQKWKFDFNYAVSHKYIPIKESIALSKKFKRALDDQKWIFDELDSGNMVEAVASNIENNAFFSLGLSSCVAGVMYADIALLQKSEYFLKKILNTFSRPDIQISIKKYLSRTYFAIAIFLDTVDKLDDAEKNLNASIKYKDNCYEVYIFLSVVLFKKRRIEDSLRAVELAKKYQKDSVWRYNKAFLLLYKNEFRDAIKEYKGLQKKLGAIANQKVTANQVVNSCLEIITVEHKNQFYYSIIFVYKKVLNNSDKAKEYYNLFLDKEEGNSVFSELIIEAKKIIEN